MCPFPENETLPCDTSLQRVARACSENIVLAKTALTPLTHVIIVRNVFWIKIYWNFWTHLTTNCIRVGCFKHRNRGSLVCCLKNSVCARFSISLFNSRFDNLIKWERLIHFSKINLCNLFIKWNTEKAFFSSALQFRLI